MSTKKITNQPDVLDDSASTDHTKIIDALRLMQQMHQKIVNSPVLNGGFDRMVEKVENIDLKVNSIHEAIYHPDDGLYARVKGVEEIKKHVENVEQLERDVLLLQQLSASKTQSDEKEEKFVAENAKAVANHEQQIKDLIDFKKRVESTVKWGLATVAGGMLTGVFKLLYDFLSAHLTVH